MSLADDREAVLMFKKEILAVFTRWDLESDLDILEMAEASVEVINEIYGDQAIEFDPDPELLDNINEEEED